jgi:hypothetical protein
LLVVDEPLDSIFSGETLDQSVFVFVHSALQIRGYSDVKYSTTAQENINVMLGIGPFRTLTESVRKRQWCKWAATLSPARRRRRAIPPLRSG